MSKGQILAEYWIFLKYYKRFWLLPIVVVLFFFGFLLCAAQVSTIAPFLYLFY